MTITGAHKSSALRFDLFIKQQNPNEQTVRQDLAKLYSDKYLNDWGATDTPKSSNNKGV